MKNRLYFFLVLVLLCSCNSEDRIDETIYVRHQGADMPVYMHGNPQSKTILLVVHGAGSFGLAYRDAAFTEVLERNYLVAYFDQRGQSMAEGHYDKPKDLITLMAQDVIAITNVIETRYGDDNSLFIMGHSWGGLLSAVTLLQDDVQTRFNGWINVAGLLDIPSSNATRKAAMLRIGEELKPNSGNSSDWQEILEEVMVIDATDDENYDILLENGAKVVDLVLKDKVVEQPLTAEKVQRAAIDNNPIHWYVANFLNRPINTALESNYTVFDSLDRIDIPSLFIYGKYDVSVPREMGEEAFNVLFPPFGEYNLYEKSMHHPFDSEPERFGNDVHDFIEKWN